MLLRERETGKEMKRKAKNEMRVIGVSDEDAEEGSDGSR